LGALRTEGGEERRGRREKRRRSAKRDEVEIEGKSRRERTIELTLALPGHDVRKRVDASGGLLDLSSHSLGNELLNQPGEGEETEGRRKKVVSSRSPSLSSPP